MLHCVRGAGGGYVLPYSDVVMLAFLFITTWCWPFYRGLVRDRNLLRLCHTSITFLLQASRADARTSTPLRMYLSI